MVNSSVAEIMIWTYIAANQPVSLSSALKRPDNVRSISSEWMLFSNRVWPSELVARQLRAKQAFLLAPVSSQLNIFAREEICKRTNESAYALNYKWCLEQTFTKPLQISDNKWALSRQNLSSGLPTKPDSNQSPRLQRLARKLKFRL